MFKKIAISAIVMSLSIMAFAHTNLNEESFKNEYVAPTSFDTEKTLVAPGVHCARKRPCNKVDVEPLDSYSAPDAIETDKTLVAPGICLHRPGKCKQIDVESELKGDSDKTGENYLEQPA